MTHQPYPCYKPSGIDWFGDIPDHWEVKKLKYCNSLIMGQSPESSDYNYDEIGMPFIQGNAEFTDRHSLPKLWSINVRKFAIENDILLSVRAPIGAVNIANKEIGIGRGLCSVRAKDSYYQFIFYQLISPNKHLNSIGTGSTYTAISVEDVANLPFIAPPLAEQTAIACYLDRETARLDGLMSQKRQLISLLQEERAGLINQAVTQGLDSNAPRKDSGLAWLGQIPAHWEVKKLKYVVTMVR